MTRSPALRADPSVGLLEQLRRADAPDRRRLVALLAERCWADVVAMYRRSGKSLDEAEDLTQSFFADVVLGRELFTRACERRGSLRALVATAARRFAIDRHRAERRAQGLVRLGDQPLPGPASGHAATDPLDRAWAIGIVEEALRRCRTHYHTTGRAAHWELFEERVLRGLVGSACPRPYAELARRHGFETERRAAAAVQSVRRTLAAHLRATVRASRRGSDHGVPVERRLLEALAPGGTS